jgi:CHAT domain-containing protein/Tfp pilus assembly protein PilF
MPRFFYCLAVFFFCFGLSCFSQEKKETKPTPQDPLQDSISKYTKLGQYPKVVPFAEQWAEQVKKDKGEKSADYGAALHTLGIALRRTGKNGEAEPILLQGLEIRRKALGEEHADVALALMGLGVLYRSMGQYRKAEPYCLKALEIWRKALGEEHEDVALALNGLGILYKSMGQYAKAEPYYLKALEIWRKALGEEHEDVATSLNNLGNLYGTMGQYPKAEPYHLKALEIRRKALGEDHADVAISLNNLGLLYLNMGQYAKAEPFQLKALEILKKSFGEEHEAVAGFLNSLGILYRDLGQNLKAEPYYLKALEIRRKVLGEEHIDVAHSLNNLGIYYCDLGQYSKAEPFYQNALEIRRKAFGEEHPDVAQALNGLGILYMSMGQYPKAETYYLKSLKIRRKALGEEHPDVGTSLHNLGNLYWTMGQYPKAEPYHLKALEIWRKALGEEHPDVALSVHMLGNLYWTMGQYPKAEGLFLKWNENKLGQIQRYFPFLSDNEKEKFYELNLSGAQENFKSFCVERYAGKKAIAVDLYNDQLATKGLLLNSSAKWKHRIKTAGDKKLNRLYDDWEISQNKLNKLLQSTDSTERAGLDSVQAKTEKMEKELSLRSENFAKLADKKQVNWKEVQKALKPGEAAIEMVRVKKLGIAKTVTDTSDQKKPVYKVKGLTDTIYYAALIVKPESLIPEMVLLKNGNDLEGKNLKYYQNAVSKQLPDNQSYQKFWEKIGAKLGTSTRVYFSPDGVFHNINLNTLFNTKTKKYLLEEKDIRLVTVTKDIVNPGLTEEDNKLAELVGFPSYYQNATTQASAFTERKSPEMTYGLRLESMGKLADLPGTKTEVDKIASILEGKGWEVKNYTGSDALEENIKEGYKPRLLHIATHGFFQADTTKGSNPLLRSGLMLTGAGSTLKGEKNETGEDGILTAYEAMNLNLDNTDLVVLSACETGLGEIKNGEGVYGLQRAFKVAGAKSIIMSLWKVSDQATQELMVSFYRHWLGKLNIGKRAAFLAAQKELKAKYSNPYYWGAFVMVGE